MKRILLVTAVIALLCMGVAASAAVFSEGFEASGYDFYADAGSWSGLSTTVAYSGNQSAQFTLDAKNLAYARWKSGDISSLGIKLKDITASAWEMRSYGRSDLAPYFLFTIATPDTTKETLAIQSNMPTLQDGTWAQNIVDRTTSTFHVDGDRTGLLATEFSQSATQNTLDALAAKQYSSGVYWGDFTVSYVRIGAGMWATGQTYNGYADAVTVNGATTAVPEPMSLLLGIMGLSSVAGFRKLRRK